MRHFFQSEHRCVVPCPLLIRHLSLNSQAKTVVSYALPYQPGCSAHCCGSVVSGAPQQHQHVSLRLL